MSQSIKSITFEGKLKVWGVYNYNTIEKKDGHNNHKGAKKFKFKTGEKKTNKDGQEYEIKKEIDYTSSRCIRHEMFKDIQPRQPSDKEFGAQFIKMVTSEIGLLRGYMSPDEKGNNQDIKGLKRCSPLHIADAQTINKVDIVFDQGSSSKPKEGSKKSKEGKDISDTSMFSQDNSPCREQKLLGGISLKELQFLSLYGVDNDFSMISKNHKDDFLKYLREYFQKHNVDNNLEIKEYEDKGAVYKIKRAGILLNQDQIRHLVTVVFQRIKMINGLKAGARLSYKKGSLKASFFDGEDYLDLEESDLKEKLNTMNFHHFFQNV
ncbi:MAG: hypothetical protein OXM55_02435 [Bdellovibrionales bacterium]|nr:hypothetical protein [Bdellovibrionales bacterium]